MSGRAEFCRVCGCTCLPGDPGTCLCRVTWQAGRACGDVLKGTNGQIEWARSQAAARLNRRLLGLPEVPEGTEGVAVQDDDPDVVASRAAAFRIARDGERPVVERAGKAGPAKGGPVPGQLRLKLPLYSVRPKGARDGR